MKLPTYLISQSLLSTLCFKQMGHPCQSDKPRGCPVRDKPVIIANKSKKQSGTFKTGPVQNERGSESASETDSAGVGV